MIYKNYNLGPTLGMSWLKFLFNKQIIIRYQSYVGWGKILGGGFCLYLHVICFDFDSGVGIGPVTLTFWPWGEGGGKHPSKTFQRPCVVPSNLSI